MATSTNALGPTREVQLPEGRIRYHDRGEGPVIVFVHGIRPIQRLPIAFGLLTRRPIPAIVDFLSGRQTSQAGEVPT